MSEWSVLFKSIAELLGYSFLPLNTHSFIVFMYSGVLYFFLTVQMGAKLYEQSSYYNIFWGYFDPIKVPLKVKLCPWAFGSQQIYIYIGSFNWETLDISMSNDHENIPN